MRKRKAIIDDGMNPELVRGADFDGYFGIPIIRKPDHYIIPTTGYFRNPTATNLESAIDGNRVVFNGRSADGTMTYVMDTDGNIIFGKRSNPNNAAKRAPHPTLIGGKDPQVQCAGMITFHKGRIQSINNDSGHYKPNSKSLDKVETVLHRLYERNASVFDKKWKWRE